jgi:uncharacterized protein (TIGR00106 family)
MEAIADISVVPIGVGVSVSKYVAACQQVFDEMMLDSRLHAYGTNLQGDLDTILAAVKRCHERVHALGAPRISTVIKLGTRVDRAQTMNEKIKSVERKLVEQRTDALPG